MPICNRCESEFDVEMRPGALMFGHPSTVREAVPVWKAHICQDCETEIVSEWKRKPITDTPNNVVNFLNEHATFETRAPQPNWIIEQAEVLQDETALPNHRYHLRLLAQSPEGKRGQYLDYAFPLKGATLGNLAARLRQIADKLTGSDDPKPGDPGLPGPVKAARCMNVSFDGARRNLANAFNRLAHDAKYPETFEGGDSSHVLVEIEQLNQLGMMIGVLLCMFDDSDPQDCNDLSQEITLNYLE